MCGLVVRELDIVEFRGIRRLASPLKLKSFNVLVGRNNTGKTSILEALYLLNHPSSADPLLESVFGQSVGSILSNLHSGSDSLVYGYHGSAKLMYKLVNSSTVGIKLNYSGRVDLKLKINKGSGNVIEDLNKYANFLTKNYKYRLLFATYIPNDSRAYDCIGKVLCSRSVWRYLVKHGLHRRVIEEIVVPSVYDKFTEVLVEEGSLKLRKEAEKDIGPLYIDVHDLGTGVERALLVALAISYAKPKLVLWDDIEVALHPTLTESLLEWLSRLNSQVVLSTHSIDVLYSLLKAYPSDAQVITLKKTVNDIVYHETLNLDELEELIEKNIDPRKLAEALEL